MQECKRIDAEAERDAALAQAGALELDMRERASVFCEVQAKECATVSEKQYRAGNEYWIANDWAKRNLMTAAAEIRALEPNPDAAAALQRALEAERKACADAAWDVRLRYPATEQDFGRVNARRDILARGDKEGNDE